MSFKWILSDYGGVLCAHQFEDDIAQMASIARMNLPPFEQAYWLRRADYDRADLTTLEYWTDVLGRAPSPGQLDELRAADIASWSHPILETVEAYEKLKKRYKLALLSNAPADLARKIETFDWLPPIHPLLFSCDLRLTKPEPRIFERTLAALDAQAEDVVFVDDRLENIRAAEELGLGVIHFHDPSQLEELGPC